MKKTTKVIVIDDHTLFRFGLMAILSKAPNFQVVGEYSGIEEAKKTNLADIDLVITDISLDDGETGMDLIKYFKKQGAQLKVAVLSMHKEEFYILSSIEAGADGYIHKDVEPSDLIMGLNKIMGGERYYSPQIAEILINNIYNKPRQNSHQPFLTRKEKEIINFLMEGLSSKEISIKLNISARTVETHRHNILSKLGLKNTTELVKKVMEHKILLQ